LEGVAAKILKMKLKTGLCERVVLLVLSPLPAAGLFGYLFEHRNTSSGESTPGLRGTVRNRNRSLKKETTADVVDIAQPPTGTKNTHDTDKHSVSNNGKTDDASFLEVSGMLNNGHAAFRTAEAQNQRAHFGNSPPPAQSEVDPSGRYRSYHGAVGGIQPDVFSSCAELFAVFPVVKRANLFQGCVNDYYAQQNANFNTQNSQSAWLSPKILFGCVWERCARESDCASVHAGWQKHCRDADRTPPGAVSGDEIGTVLEAGEQQMRQQIRLAEDDGEFESASGLIPNNNGNGYSFYNFNDYRNKNNHDGSTTGADTTTMASSFLQSPLPFDSFPRASSFPQQPSYGKDSKPSYGNNKKQADFSNNKWMSDVQKGWALWFHQISETVRRKAENWTRNLNAWMWRRELRKFHGSVDAFLFYLFLQHSGSSLSAGGYGSSAGDTVLSRVAKMDSDIVTRPFLLCPYLIAQQWYHADHFAEVDILESGKQECQNLDWNAKLPDLHTSVLELLTSRDADEATSALQVMFRAGNAGISTPMAKCVSVYLMWQLQERLVEPDEDLAIGIDEAREKTEEIVAFFETADYSQPTGTSTRSGKLERYFTQHAVSLQLYSKQCITEEETVLPVIRDVFETRFSVGQNSQAAHEESGGRMETLNVNTQLGSQIDELKGTMAETVQNWQSHYPEVFHAQAKTFYCRSLFESSLVGTPGRPSLLTQLVGNPMPAEDSFQQGIAARSCEFDPAAIGGRFGATGNNFPACIVQACDSVRACGQIRQRWRTHCVGEAFQDVSVNAYGRRELSFFVFLNMDGEWLSSLWHTATQLVKSAIRRGKKRHTNKYGAGINKQKVGKSIKKVFKFPFQVAKEVAKRTLSLVKTTVGLIFFAKPIGEQVEGKEEVEIENDSFVRRNTNDLSDEEEYYGLIDAVQAGNVPLHLNQDIPSDDNWDDDDFSSSEEEQEDAAPVQEEAALLQELKQANEERDGTLGGSKGQQGAPKQNSGLHRMMSDLFLDKDLGDENVLSDEHRLASMKCPSYAASYLQTLWQLHNGNFDRFQHKKRKRRQEVTNAVRGRTTSVSRDFSNNGGPSMRFVPYRSILEQVCNYQTRQALLGETDHKTPSHHFSVVQEDARLTGVPAALGVLRARSKDELGFNSCYALYLETLINSESAMDGESQCTKKWSHKCEAVPAKRELYRSTSVSVWEYVHSEKFRRQRKRDYVENEAAKRAARRDKTKRRPTTERKQHPGATHSFLESAKTGQRNPSLIQSLKQKMDRTVYDMKHRVSLFAPDSLTSYFRDLHIPVELGLFDRKNKKASKSYERSEMRSSQDVQAVKILVGDLQRLLNRYRSECSIDDSEPHENGVSLQNLILPYVTRNVEAAIFVEGLELDRKSTTQLKRACPGTSSHSNSAVFSEGVSPHDAGHCPPKVTAASWSPMWRPWVSHFLESERQFAASVSLPHFSECTYVIGSNIAAAFNTLASYNKYYRDLYCPYEMFKLPLRHDKFVSQSAQKSIDDKTLKYRRDPSSLFVQEVEFFNRELLGHEFASMPVNVAILHAHYLANTYEVDDWSASQHKRRRAITVNDIDFRQEYESEKRDGLWLDPFFDRKFPTDSETLRRVEERKQKKRPSSFQDAGGDSTSKGSHHPREAQNGNIFGALRKKWKRMVSTVSGEQFVRNGRGVEDGSLRNPKDTEWKPMYTDESTSDDAQPAHLNDWEIEQLNQVDGETADDENVSHLRAQHLRAKKTPKHTELYLSRNPVWRCFGVFLTDMAVLHREKDQRHDFEKQRLSVFENFDFRDRKAVDASKSSKTSMSQRKTKKKSRSSSEKDELLVENLLDIRKIRDYFLNRVFENPWILRKFFDASTSKEEIRAHQFQKKKSEITALVRELEAKTLSQSPPYRSRNEKLFSLVDEYIAKCGEPAYQPAMHSALKNQYSDEYTMGGEIGKGASQSKPNPVDMLIPGGESMRMGSKSRNQWNTQKNKSWNPIKRFWQRKEAKMAEKGLKKDTTSSSNNIRGPTLVGRRFFRRPRKHFVSNVEEADNNLGTETGATKSVLSNDVTSIWTANYLSWRVLYEKKKAKEEKRKQELDLDMNAGAAEDDFSIFERVKRLVVCSSALLFYFSGIDKILAMLFG